MKRKLRIVIDCGDTFCAGCKHVCHNGFPTWCALFQVPLVVAGESKPKRHAKCLEAEGMR